MKPKRNIKKLRLSRETVRTLTPTMLSEVAGAVAGTNDTCDTCFTQYDSCLLYQSCQSACAPSICPC
jgi:hypothetical protein